MNFPVLDIGRRWYDSAYRSLLFIRTKIAEDTQATTHQREINTNVIGNIVSKHQTNREGKHADTNDKSNIDIAHGRAYIYGGPVPNSLFSNSRFTIDNEQWPGQQTFPDDEKQQRTVRGNAGEHICRNRPGSRTWDRRVPFPASLQYHKMRIIMRALGIQIAGVIYGF